MAKLGSSWGAEEELLHPRGRDGRFISKAGVGMLTAVAKRIAQLLARINYREFGSDQQASQYLFSSYKDWPEGDKRRLLADLHDTNVQLQAGRMDASTKKFVDMMDAQLQPAHDDLILHRSMGPEAFGIDPAFMDADDGGVWDLPGKVVSSKGYTPTRIGSPGSGGPIHMAIVAPKGTKIAPTRNGPNDRGVMMDRDLPIRITKVDRDGRGGYHITAVVDTEGGGEEPHPLRGTERETGATPEMREARATAPPTLMPSERRLEQQDVAEQQRVAEFERRQREGTLAPPGPGPTDTGPGGPPPRNEPILKESVGGAPSPEGPSPEAAPEEPIRTVDFRAAFDEAGIGAPSDGPRRRQFNKAYEGVTSGKRRPEDALRELEADIAVNDRALAQAEADGISDKDREFKQDIAIQRQLADLIAEQHGLERGKRDETPKPTLSKQDIAEEDIVGRAQRVRPGEPSEKPILEKAAQLQRAKEISTGRRHMTVEQARHTTALEALSKDRIAGDDGEKYREIARKVQSGEWSVPRAQFEARQEVRRLRNEEKMARTKMDNASGDRARGFRREADEHKALADRYQKLQQGLRESQTAESTDKFVNPPEGPRKPVVAPVKKAAPAKRAPAVKKAAPKAAREPDEVEAEAAQSLAQFTRTRDGKSWNRVPASKFKTDVLDKLERDGLVTVDRDANQRRQVSITPTGEKRIPARDIDQMTKAELLADPRAADAKPSWTKDRIKAHIRGETPTPVKRAPAKKAAPKAPAKATPKLSTDPAVREVQVENRIRAAYRDLAEPRGRNQAMYGWVSLTDLRQRLGDIPRAEVDRALVRMARSDHDGPGAVRLVPQENRNALTGADRASAVRVGTQDNHLIGFEDPAPRPLPAPVRTSTPAATTIPVRGGGAVDTTTGEFIPPIVDTPAAQKPIQVPDRKSSFDEAWDEKGFEAPQGSANRSLQEIRDDISSGRITPDEGIRRLETEIDLNSQEMIDMDQTLRGDLTPEGRQDLLAQRKQLGQSIRAQADASRFLRDHFKKEPDVTPDEVKVALVESDSPEARTLGERMRDMSPADVKDLKQQLKDGGYGDVEGDTGEEVFDNALKLIIKRELAERQKKKEAKLAPAPKAPDKAKPNLEGSRYQRIDARALAEGLDLRREDDVQMLDRIQRLLDGEDDSLGKNPTPAQIGRYLESWMKGPAGPGTQAAYHSGVAGNKRFGESDEDFQARLVEIDKENAPRMKSHEEWGKLADRLMNTRRQRAQDRAPDVEPKVTREEKKEISGVSELTGIPQEDLEKAALRKKKAEAPPKQSAQQVAETLKTVGNRQEARDLLQGRTKAELLEILKASGFTGGPRRGSKATKQDIIIDIVGGNVGARLDARAIRESAPTMFEGRTTPGGEPRYLIPKAGMLTRQDLMESDLETLKRIEDDMGIKRHSLNKQDRVDAIIRKAGGPEPEPPTPGGGVPEPSTPATGRLSLVPPLPEKKTPAKKAAPKRTEREGPQLPPSKDGLSQLDDRDLRDLAAEYDIPVADRMFPLKPEDRSFFLSELRDRNAISPAVQMRLDRLRNLGVVEGGREGGGEKGALTSVPGGRKETPEPPAVPALTPEEVTQRVRARRLQVLQGGGEGGEGTGPGIQRGPAPVAVNEDVPLAGDVEGDNSIMHGDSATMELAQAYAKKNRNGTANRLMELRRQISTQRGEDSKDLDGPQRMVDELKRLREIETDDQLRRQLDDAIRELDFPQTPVPDLPDGTPPALRTLLEDLNKIPVARAPKGSRLHGFIQKEDSPVESLAQLIREIGDSKGQVSIGETERKIEDILRRYHESIDGAYRMWGLSTRAENDNALRKQLTDWVKGLRQGG